MHHSHVWWSTTSRLKRIASSSAGSSTFSTAPSWRTTHIECLTLRTPHATTREQQLHSRRRDALEISRARLGLEGRHRVSLSLDLRFKEHTLATAQTVYYKQGDPSRVRTHTNRGVSLAQVIRDSKYTFEGTPDGMVLHLLYVSCSPVAGATQQGNRATAVNEPHARTRQLESALAGVPRH